MGGWEVEQVNFAVTVQSQAGSRVAKFPDRAVGRLTLTTPRDVSRQGNDNSFEIKAPGRVSFLYPTAREDHLYRILD